MCDQKDKLILKKKIKKLLSPWRHGNTKPAQVLSIISLALVLKNISFNFVKSRKISKVYRFPKEA